MMPSTEQRSELLQSRASPEPATVSSRASGERIHPHHPDQRSTAATRGEGAEMEQAAVRQPVVPMTSRHLHASSALVGCAPGRPTDTCTTSRPESRRRTTFSATFSATFSTTPARVGPVEIPPALGSHAFRERIRRIRERVHRSQKSQRHRNGTSAVGESFDRGAVGRVAASRADGDHLDRVRRVVGW